MAVVATPDYLAKSGTPANPGDLAMHKGVGWTFVRTLGGWPFLSGTGTVEISPPPVGARPAMVRPRAGALALWRGRFWRGSRCFISAPTSRAGRLIPVLQDFNPGDCEDIHAVVSLGKADHCRRGVRTFIDFLGWKNIRLEDLDLARTPKRRMAGSGLLGPNFDDFPTQRKRRTVPCARFYGGRMPLSGVAWAQPVGCPEIPTSLMTYSRDASYAPLGRLPSERKPNVSTLVSGT